MTFNERARSAANLDRRIALNRKYQSKDFTNWLFEHIDVRPHMNVLDIGTGTGNQATRFANLVSPGGEVVALDVSADAINALRKRADAENLPIDAQVADMNELHEIVEKQNFQRKFDIAHSSYAIYYAADPIDVARAMIRTLKKSGEIVVAVPGEPNGLVELARKFTSIPKAVDNSLRIGINKIKPFLEKEAVNLSIHTLENSLNIDNSDDVLDFYRSTTYYTASVESEMRGYVNDVIDRDGVFEFEKTTVLLQARVE